MQDYDDLKLVSTEIGDTNLIQMTGNIDLYTTPELDAPSQPAM